MEQLDILLPRHPLEEALGPELAKQARLRWGEQCRFMPVSDGENYRCSCGCVNPLGKACEECGMLPELMDRGVLETLRQEAELRLQQEAEEAARQEALRRQEAKRQKRRKIRNICLWAAGAVGVLLLSVVAFWGITRFAIPENHYQKALLALEKGDYQQAHRRFTLAGDYKDAKAYLDRFATPLLSSRFYSEKSQTEMKYTYDENGCQLKCVERVLTLDANGNWLEIRAPMEFEQVYDADGKMLVHTNWNGHTEYVYNAQGDVIQEDFYRQDGQQETARAYNYEYDDLGRITKKAEICSELLSVNNSYEQIEYFTYDARGLVSERIEEVNCPAQMDNSYRTVQRWTYNEKGDPVEKLEETASGINRDADKSSGRKTWEYDSQGRLLQSVDTISFPEDPDRDRSITITNTYDAKGRLILTVTDICFPGDTRRSSVGRETWEYDWEGKLKKETSELVYASEMMQSYGGNSQAVTYTYDLLGRLIEQETLWEGPVEISRRLETYSYGTDGMVDAVTIEEFDGDNRSEITCLYNDNGLLEKEIRGAQDADVHLDGTVEYAYAYFYYPEGVEKPRQNPMEIGVVVYGY